jgi:hypothetical protein
LGLGVQAPTAGAAEIAWERVTPFQGCLDADLKEWLEIQANALTNGNRDASGIDDRTVFMWTFDTVAACKAKVGVGDEAIASHFREHMAQWRQHVQERVDDVKQQGKPD